MEILANVIFETSFTRPFNFNVEYDGEEKQESIFLSMLKPKITLVTALGQETIAPYGEPNHEIQSLVTFIALGLGILVAATLTIKLMR